MPSLAQLVTTVSVLTPAGRGAVATVLVSGTQAAAQVAALLHTAGRLPLSQRPLRSIVLGRWRDSQGEEVVVSRLTAEQVEIHCHGGIAAAPRIVADLVAAGCREMPWAELSSASVITAGDAIQQEALFALASARTERTAGLLLEQYEGALCREVLAILELLAAELASNSKPNIAISERLELLLSRAPLGLHLTKPWSVVLAGKPNVGKSSLINALLGYRRAIVFDTPGTTRDIVTATTACAGWPVELADTAGWREGANSLEAQGIAAAKAAAAEADLVLLVADQSQPWNAEDEALAAACPTALLVWNKADLAADKQMVQQPRRGISVSALTGTGLPELLAEIAARLAPHVPAPGSALPFTSRQVSGLQAARAALIGNDLAAAIGELKELIRPAL